MGQFRQGEKVTVQIEVEVEAIHFKGVRAKYTNELVGVDRIHTAVIEAADTSE
jgi:hypothetical protein